MRPSEDRVERLLKRLDAAWQAFNDSYAGLPDSRLTEPDVTGDWSIKDLLAHVTIWELEAMKYVPLIIEGGRPPRYATHGGIDAFNARTMAQKQNLSLPTIRKQLDETHNRLIDFIKSLPEDQLTQESRVRRRLRLDTYGHYREHTEAIRQWRSGNSDSPKP